MKKMLTASAALLALAAAAPVFAGGDHCGGAASAESKMSCSSHAATTAWSGVWLQRSTAGIVTVADVAKGSPAARSGLKAGDVVVAVNGYDLADQKERAMCASKANCQAGCAVTYTVQRGRSTKAIKLKLEKMPALATERFASRQASFDPALASLVMPAIN